MKIILLGAPGVGKGTVASFLVRKLKIPHISAGDLLREEAKINENVSGIINQGKLVPDEIISEIIEKRLKKEDCENGFILDGYPRTIEQAEFLDDKNINIDLVINLKATEDEIVKRLSGRLVCEKCGAIYNTETIIPKKEGICDKCGGKLIQRKDDMPETIRNRFKVYEKETAPLIDFYGKKGILKEVNTEKGIEPTFKLVSELF